jgi:heme/copper-type cytochrome/quinol oxidase subunit 3
VKYPLAGKVMAFGILTILLLLVGFGVWFAVGHVAQGNAYKLIVPLIVAVVIARRVYRNSGRIIRPTPKKPS